MKSLPTCSQCGKQLSSSSALSQHMYTHAAEKPWTCPYCGKGFSQKAKHREHLYRHRGEPPFTCEDCGKGFYQKDRLITHRMNHSGLRPFSCECGLEFRRRYELTKHRKHHDATEKAKLRRHACTLCPMRCESRADLAKHMLKHSSVRNFPCPHCNRLFKDKYTRKNHLLLLHEEVLNFSSLTKAFD